MEAPAGRGPVGGELEWLLRLFGVPKSSGVGSEGEGKGDGEGGEGSGDGVDALTTDASCVGIGADSFFDLLTAYAMSTTAIAAASGPVKGKHRGAKL